MEKESWWIFTSHWLKEILPAYYLGTVVLWPSDTLTSWLWKLVTDGLSLSTFGGILFSLHCVWIFWVTTVELPFLKSKGFYPKIYIFSISWKLEDLATGLEGGTAPTWHRPYILQPAVSLITYQSGCYRHVPAFIDSFWRLSPGNLNLIDYLNNIKWLDFSWVENDQKTDLSTNEMSIYVISTTKRTSGSGRGVIGLDKIPLGSIFHRWRDAPSLMRRREGSPRLRGLKEDLCFTFDIPWGKQLSLESGWREP